MASFAEARGNDDEAFYTLFAAFFGDFKDELGGYGYDSGIDRAGDIGDGGVDFEAEDFGGGGVDRVDLAFVFALYKVIDYGIADLAGGDRGTDHGDGFWSKQTIDDFLIHEYSS